MFIAVLSHASALALGFTCGVSRSLLRDRALRELAARLLACQTALAAFQSRAAKARRYTDLERLWLTLLDRFGQWSHSLPLVSKSTLVRWHNNVFRPHWWFRSRKPGRPPIPKDARALIHRLASENPTWGQERIAAELRLKLGIQVSPRTVAKYCKLSGRPRPLRRGDKRWMNFIRRKARQGTALACDFFTVVPLNFFRFPLYVFVLLDIGRLRIVHFAVTFHPSAQWTLQQFRNALDVDHPFRYLVHDRDSIFSAAIDRHLRAFSLLVLKTPVQSPQANAFCERLIGTIRRECLDFVIPFGEDHLRRVLYEWVDHYNRARPHSALGPGVPNGNPTLPFSPGRHERHCIPAGYRVASKSVVDRLHHEYRLEKIAA